PSNLGLCSWAQPASAPGGRPEGAVGRSGEPPRPAPNRTLRRWLERELVALSAAIRRSAGDAAPVAASTRPFWPRALPRRGAYLGASRYRRRDVRGLGATGRRGAAHPGRRRVEGRWAPGVRRAEAVCWTRYAYVHRAEG